MSNTRSRVEEHGIRKGRIRTFLLESFLSPFPGPFLSLAKPTLLPFFTESSQLQVGKDFFHWICPYRPLQGGITFHLPDRPYSMPFYKVSQVSCRPLSLASFGANLSALGWGNVLYLTQPARAFTLLFLC